MQRTELSVDGRMAGYPAAFRECGGGDATLGGVASWTGSKRRGTQLALYPGWLPFLTIARAFNELLGHVGQQSGARQGLAAPKASFARRLSKIEGFPTSWS